jgi:DNA-binding NarL/FixJ family response regulator
MGMLIVDDHAIFREGLKRILSDDRLKTGRAVQLIAVQNLRVFGPGKAGREPVR